MAYPCQPALSKFVELPLCFHHERRPSARSVRRSIQLWSGVAQSGADRPHRSVQEFYMSRFWKVALIVIAVIVVAALGFRLLHKPAAANGSASTRSEEHTSQLQSLM